MLSLDEVRNQQRNRARNLFLWKFTTSATVYNRVQSQREEGAHKINKLLLIVEKIDD